jgi:hypothetical protein
LISASETPAVFNFVFVSFVITSFKLTLFLIFHKSIFDKLRNFSSDINHVNATSGFSLINSAFSSQSSVFKVSLYVLNQLVTLSYFSPILAHILEKSKSHILCKFCGISFLKNPITLGFDVSAAFEIL